MENEDGMVSVIVPIYNADQYLEECVESVLVQTIGREHIQLVLVDNASTDGSRELCDQYQKNDPSCVTFLPLEEHVGSAAARKAGLLRATGKYVAFLEAEDKWEADALEKLQGFFEEHDEEIDFAASRVRNFGSREGWQSQECMFRKNAGILDIHDAYERIATAFHGLFRASAVKQAGVDTDSLDAEGLLLVTKVLLNKGKFGVVPAAIYDKRQGHNSMSSKLPEKGNPTEYVQSLERELLSLLKASRAAYGECIPYVQFLMMHLIKQRISSPLPKWMGKKERPAYLQGLRRFLQHIDDHIIAEQQGLHKEHKLFCLRLKYGDDAKLDFSLRDGSVWFHNVPWFQTSDRSLCRCKSFGIHRGVLCLSGVLNLPLPKGSYEVFAVDSEGNEYPFQFDESMERKVYCIGQVIHIRRQFRVSVPIGLEGKARFVLRLRHVETSLRMSWMERAFSALRVFSMRELSSLGTLQEDWDSVEGKE